MAAAVASPPSQAHGQMSEALQRFLREEDDDNAQDLASDGEPSRDELAPEKLDLGNLDITSTAISLQGSLRAQHLTWNFAG